MAKTDVIGIDNIAIKAKRSPEFYATVKPMLNIGAMMQYVKGPGGIVLCNVLFQDQESVPENLKKKRAILSAILRNLKAPFAGAKTIIAGAKNLEYRPIDISKFATQYRDEKGWFGEKQFTFKDMPTGRQVLGGVPFDIFEFATSPVPTVIMLEGRVPGKMPREVKGIPVGQKADAIFFLQTARIEQRMNPNEIRQKKRFETLRYVITYEDGQSANVPVYAEIDIDDFKQTEPRAIPGARSPGLGNTKARSSPRWPIASSGTTRARMPRSRASMWRTATSGAACRR